MPKQKTVNSWWPRFWAWLIDIIIIGAASWLISPPSFFMGGAGMMNGFWDTWHFGTRGIIGLIYWAILESEGRQSIGKKALKLRLARVDGKKVDMGTAAVSAFGKAFLLPFDFIIGVLARPGKKQRLFNIASDTVVVNE